MPRGSRRYTLVDRHFFAPIQQLAPAIADSEGFSARNAFASWEEIVVQAISFKRKDIMSVKQMQRRSYGGAIIKPDPYYEDPAEYFAYKPVLETRQVIVIPTRPEYADVLKAAEEIIGINRTELKDLRFQPYCQYMTYRRALADPGISPDTRTDIAARIADMVDGGEAYAGMLRHLEPGS